MKAFDEIIRQALREGIAVEFQPDSILPGGSYTATFRFGRDVSKVRIDAIDLRSDCQEEAEAYSLIRAIEDLKSHAYQDIYKRHFEKGEDENA